MVSAFIYLYLYTVDFGFNDTHLGRQKRSLYAMCRYIRSYSKCVLYILMDTKYIHYDIVRTLANMKSLHMTNRMICNIMYVQDTTQYLSAYWKNLVIEDCCNAIRILNYDP